VDLMEEFEFKPITEGLGFHKKKASTPETSLEMSLSASSFSVEEDIKSKLPSFLEEDSALQAAQVETKKKALEEKVSHLPFDFSQSAASIFSPTLPREAPKTSVTSSKVSPPPTIDLPRERVSVPKLNTPKFKSSANPAVEKQSLKQQESVSEILRPSLKQETILEPISNKIEIEKAEPVLIESTTSATAIVLDFLMVIGLAVLFTLSLILATGLDVVTITTQSTADLGTQVGIALLIYSVSQLYMIITRSFFGQTLGEWSLEQQLGTAAEQNKFSYIFKLLFRTFIVSITGFILLPIASAILKKDVAGRISGVCLQRKE